MTRMLQFLVSRAVSVPVAATMGMIARRQSMLDGRDIERLKARLDWRVEPAPRRRRRRTARWA